jgi:hypothetical protein
MSKVGKASGYGNRLPFGNKVIESAYLMEQAAKTAKMSHQTTKMKPIKKGPKCYLNDNQYALIRGDSELRGLSIKEICTKWSLDDWLVRQILQYITRKYVDPV